MLTQLLWLFISAILYTYIGYPALVAILSRVWPRPEPYPPATPSVTILIPAYNEEAVIAQKLENTLVLDYPHEKLQILVVTDGSTDRTNDIVYEYANRNVELSHHPVRGGKMAAINRVMSLARGIIIVFSDANNLYKPNALRELVAPFSDSTIGAVVGAKSILKNGGVLGESEGLYWRYESFIRENETLLGCCTGVNGEILAIRHSLFASPPDSIINDDFYMAMQLIRSGHRVVYAPAARSYERVSVSAKDEMERRTRIIAGRYQAMAMAHKLLPLNRPLITWQIISHKFMRPLVPLFMIGALITNLIAAIHPAALTYQVLLGIQFLFYTLALIGNRIEGKGKGIISKILYLPAFLVNSNFAALAGLWRFLRGRQTPLWKRVPRREEKEFVQKDEETNET